eukprot:5555841-Prymnesium_polylepis.2
MLGRFAGDEQRAPCVDRPLRTLRRCAIGQRFSTWNGRLSGSEHLEHHHAQGVHVARHVRSLR